MALMAELMPTVRAFSCFWATLIIFLLAALECPVASLRKFLTRSLSALATSRGLEGLVALLFTTDFAALLAA